jgi:hypothetical protein
MTSTYRGRLFTDADLDRIREILAEPITGKNRRRAALAVCPTFDWRGMDGRPKIASAQGAMFAMARDGLIILPQRGPQGPRSREVRVDAAPQAVSLACPLDELRPLVVRRVTTKDESALHNALIAHYLYLGYTRRPGASVRYLAYARDGALVAAFTFTSAAWKIEARDRVIGWSSARRAERLHLVLQNSRFLILPSVRVPHLASHLLALVRRQVADDIAERYGYRPCLLETFVEQGRFTAASYRAAGFVRVGQTQGRGKWDREKRKALAIKDVYLCPLIPSYRQMLTGDAQQVQGR